MSKTPTYRERTPLEQIIFMQMARILEAQEYAAVGYPDRYVAEVEGLISILLPYTPKEYVKKLNEITTRYMKDDKSIRSSSFGTKYAHPMAYARQKFSICSEIISMIEMGLTKRKKNWWDVEIEREIEDELARTSKKSKG